MNSHDTKVEFSTRRAWNGKLILIVKDFNRFPATGEWIDADGTHLPTFFYQLQKGKQP